MTTIALGSVKGAPGVTTAVLALAAVWPEQRPLVVVEADPDGGVLAARRALGFEPGLVGLAAACRRGVTDVGMHSQPLSDSVRVVIAPSTAAQVRASLAAAGDDLWPALTGGGDALFDCGRLSVASPAIGLAACADHTLVLARPRIEDIALIRDRIAPLRSMGIAPKIVLIDDGPYRTDEVGDAVDAPVVARLPIDHRAADALNGVAAYHRLHRSRLLRTVRALVDDLTTSQRHPPADNGAAGSVAARL
ncbi:hypothetical protein BH23ACT10_BH23ACT10_08030 [soil metagenome]